MKVFRNSCSCRWLKRKKAQLAKGQIVECDVVAPVEIKFKNRRSTCSAMVLPRRCGSFIGSNTSWEMDVLVHPLRQELTVNPDHPYFAQKNEIMSGIFKF